MGHESPKGDKQKKFGNLCTSTVLQDLSCNKPDVNLKRAAPHLPLPPPKSYSKKEIISNENSEQSMVRVCSSNPPVVSDTRFESPAPHGCGDGFEYVNHSTYLNLYTDLKQLL